MGVNTYLPPYNPEEEMLTATSPAKAAAPELGSAPSPSPQKARGTQDSEDSRKVDNMGAVHAGVAERMRQQ